MLTNLPIHTQGEPFSGKVCDHKTVVRFEKLKECFQSSKDCVRIDLSRTNKQY